MMVGENTSDQRGSINGTKDDIHNADDSYGSYGRWWQCNAQLRISVCFTMFGDFERASDTLSKDIGMHKLANKYGVKIKETHSLVERRPLRVTERSTKETFEIGCVSSRTRCERYRKFERVE